MSDGNLYDVIIVGAGVFGMATAYYLKQTDRSLSVLVVDREGGAGEGNTCKSAAGFRNTFSSPENVILTNTSIDKFSDIDKAGFGLNIKMCGYLWLMTDDKFKKSQDSIVAMKNNGVDFSVLFAEELRAIPGLNVDSYSSEECQMMGLSRIKCGLLGKKCGSIDPGAIVSYYESEFKKLGGLTKYNTEVTSLILEPREKLDIPGEPLVWQEPKISGVRTKNGDLLAKMTIVAAGSWAKSLLDPIGIDAHIKPKKRQLFQVKGSSLEPLIKNTPGFNDLNMLPFTIIQKAGIYVKAEPRENCVYVGCADDIGRAFNLDCEPEREYYENSILPVLVEVFPQFKNAHMESMIAGSYAYNTIDKNPYVYRPVDDLLVVSGDSGSGIMKCDSIGRIATALYWKEEYAILYPNVPFKVSKLGVVTRDVTFERFVI